MSAHGQYVWLPLRRDDAALPHSDVTHFSDATYSRDLFAKDVMPAFKGG